MSKLFSVAATGFLLLALANGTATSQQPPARQAGNLAGRVVDSKSGSGIGGALVKLFAATTATTAAPVNPGSAVPTPLVAVTTDGQGRFSIPVVPVGSYTVTASKDDYIDGAYGKTRYFELARPLVFSGVAPEIRIDLWRYAVLTGSVTDGFGEPAIGFTVAVLERNNISGRPVYSKRLTVVTDDQGAFRAPRLTPGEYTACVPSVQRTLPSDIYDLYFSGQLVLDRHLRRQLGFMGAELLPPTSPIITRVGDLVWSTGSRPSSETATLVYPSTCPPSTTDLLTASLVQLKTGDVGEPLRIGISQVKGLRVSGQLSGPEGVAAHTTLRLLSRNSSILFRDTGFEAGVTLTDAGGQFTFMGIPSGQYIIQSSVMSSDKTTPQPASTTTTALRWLAHSFTVGDTDVRDLDLRLREGFQIAGRVALEGDAGAAGQAGRLRFTLALEPADGRYLAVAPVISQPDGGFVFKDVPPGRYLLRTNNEPAGWTLQEARLNGRDVSDEPFDVATASVAGLVVTLTNRPTELILTAHVESGSPDPRATVYAVTTDRRFWTEYGWRPRRLREARTDVDGSSTMTGLPPGEYFVLALSESAAGQSRTLAETFEMVSQRGRKVQIAAAEHLRVRLQVDRRP